MNFRGKIIAWDKLPEWRRAFRASGKKLVVTNGCFDILHFGHVTYLESARNLGDALLVGINGDDSARELKGAGRPVNSENDRAAVIAALESVDGVCIFAEKTATKFLSAAQPDIYVKGGDYTLETLNQDERRAVESGGRKNCHYSVGARQIHDGVAGKNFAAWRDPAMKILVISLAGIGDTLLATPLIHELRANFPDATIDALVLWAGSKDLLEDNPHLGRVHQ